MQKKIAAVDAGFITSLSHSQRYSKDPFRADQQNRRTVAAGGGTELSKGQSQAARKTSW